jgi:hypothetical protein
MKLLPEVRIAKEGDLVTCVNGHPICNLSEDIYFCQSVKPKLFVNYYEGQAELRIGFRIPRDTFCAVCGQPYMRCLSGVQIHIDGIWVPELVKESQDVTGVREPL